MKGLGGQAWLLGLIAGAGLLVLAIGINALPTREPELPVLATVPPFELTEASGKNVTREDLAGAPWVGDLIFTSCAGVCPRMTTAIEIPALARASARPSTVSVRMARRYRGVW